MIAWGDLGTPLAPHPPARVRLEADLRHYVRECLRECAGRRIVEAATIAAAVALAAVHPPACLVLDEPERDVPRALAPHRAVLLLDDAPHDMPRDMPRDAPWSSSRLRLLARPFTARELVAAVDGLVG